MTLHRRSYWKTVIPALIASAMLVGMVIALIAAAVLARGWSGIGWILWGAAAFLVIPAAGACVLVAVGGLISLRRDTLEGRGRPYGLPDSVKPGR